MGSARGDGVRPSASHRASNELPLMRMRPFRTRMPPSPIVNQQGWHQKVPGTCGGALGWLIVKAMSAMPLKPAKSHTHAQRRVRRRRADIKA